MARIFSDYVNIHGQSEFYYHFYIFYIFSILFFLGFSESPSEVKVWDKNRPEEGEITTQSDYSSSQEGDDDEQTNNKNMRENEVKKEKI